MPAVGENRSVPSYFSGIGRVKWEDDLRAALRATAISGCCSTDSSIEEHLMLRWALICLVIALLASVFGMYNLEGTAMEAARILFFVFLVLIVVGCITGRRTPLA